MEKVVRDFKGIWIPKEIWLSTKLTSNEKILLVEIDSLDNSQGCFASNGYFAKFFNLSKTRISEMINSLTQRNYITSSIIYKDGSKEIAKRILRINHDYNYTEDTPIQDTLITHSENCNTPSINCNTPSINCNDNNTINNTNNNTNNKKETQFLSSSKQTSLLPIKHSVKTFSNKDETLNIIVKQVIEHFNTVMHKNLGFGKSNTQIIKTLIQELKTSFNIEVTGQMINKVIDYKIWDWTNNRSVNFDGLKFLNSLETVLNPQKFAKYMNECPYDFKLPDDFNIDEVSKVVTKDNIGSGLSDEKRRQHNQEAIDKLMKTSNSQVQSITNNNLDVF